MYNRTTTVYLLLEEDGSSNVSVTLENDNSLLNRHDDQRAGKVLEYTTDNKKVNQVAAKSVRTAEYLFICSTGQK